MSTTLKLEIEISQAILRDLEKEVRARKDIISKLEGQRAQCHHVFRPAVKGYEHEGGQCIECGINEVYAYCNKIGVF
jgi:hypothetical protein